VVSTFVREFHRTKQLAERAVAQLGDAQLHAQLDPESNSVAIIMVHMSGNLRSRWTDFLTTDGEKPWRHRDGEFDAQTLTRDTLLASWDEGWAVLFATLATLTDDDLTRTVTIRGEGHTVLAALTRQLGHYSGHAFQIVFLAKHLAGPAWSTLSIGRGQSAAYNDSTRAAASS